jgi:hypothetical protein
LLPSLSVSFSAHITRRARGFLRFGRLRTFSCSAGGCSAWVSGPAGVKGALAFGDMLPVVTVCFLPDGQPRLRFCGLFHCPFPFVVSVFFILGRPPLRPLRRAAAFCAAVAAEPPRRPRATAEGFFFSVIKTSQRVWLGLVIYFFNGRFKGRPSSSKARQASVAVPQFHHPAAVVLLLYLGKASQRWHPVTAWIVLGWLRCHATTIPHRWGLSTEIHTYFWAMRLHVWDKEKAAPGGSDAATKYNQRFTVARSGGSSKRAVAAQTLNFGRPFLPARCGLTPFRCRSRTRCVTRQAGQNVSLPTSRGTPHCWQRPCAMRRI